MQEREKRKKFVVERGLLDLKNILNEEKKKPKVVSLYVVTLRWSRIS